ncbi:hypothetical protein O6H91_20G055200 [Diphasiastrum complanatum]|uniref:Uncharacterized protein n=1 Tax=Diphasiastrum complanatum TaxID=34168 RepID=A0ACC2AQH0_DIPCM|nr:hypothetical protein O6H91_20G055200 [Diphasiastrum complanatum]
MPTSSSLMRRRKGWSPPPAMQSDGPTEDVVVLKEPVYRLNSVDEEANQAMDMGDYDKALYLRMQAMALAKLCLGDPGSSVVGYEDLLPKAHLNISRTYHDMMYADQACWHAQKAMEQCDPRRGGESSSSLLVSTLLALAKAMLQKGDFNCVDYLQRAVLINHDLHGNEHRSNAEIYEAFADFYIHRGDLNFEAKDDKPARVQTKLPDQTSQYDAEEMSILDYQKIDDYEKAMQELHKAWEVIEQSKKRIKGDLNDVKQPQSVHSLLGPIYAKMARTRFKQERFPEASQHYEQAIAAHCATSFMNESAIAQLNFELGVTYHKQKKYEESIRVLDKAAKFCEEHRDVGGYHPLTMHMMQQQGITLYDAGDLLAAKNVFEDLMNLQRAQYGGGSIAVAESLRYLGDISIASKNTTEACGYYKRALKILRKRLGSSDETVKQLVQYIRQLNVQAATAS